MSKGKVIVIKQMKHPLPLYVEKFKAALLDEYGTTQFKCNGEMLLAVAKFIDRYMAKHKVNIYFGVGFPFVKILTKTGNTVLLDIQLEK